MIDSQDVKSLFRFTFDENEAIRKLVLMTLRNTIALLVFASCFGGFAHTALAENGFDQVARAATEGDERTKQPGIWVMEVHMKPVRIMWADITDPKKNETKKEQIWYLVYRAINRPVKRPPETETTPQNPVAKEPGPPQFIPSFTMVTQDGKAQQTIDDEILPEALKEILKVERRKLKDSVNVVRAVPAPTTEDVNDANSIYGVATFRGVDPSTDRFVIYMSGFSNGYQMAEDPNGETIVLRKTLKQEFWRPGDRFDVDSKEFRFEGDAEWVYRPDPKP